MTVNHPSDIPCHTALFCANSADARWLQWQANSKKGTCQRRQKLTCLILRPNWSMKGVGLAAGGPAGASRLGCMPAACISLLNCAAISTSPCRSKPAQGSACCKTSMLCCAFRMLHQVAVSLAPRLLRQVYSIEHNAMSEPLPSSAVTAKWNTLSSGPMCEIRSPQSTYCGAQSKSRTLEKVDYFTACAGLFSWAKGQNSVLCIKYILQRSGCSRSFQISLHI